MRFRFMSLVAAVLSMLTLSGVSSYAQNIRIDKPDLCAVAKHKSPFSFTPKWTVGVAGENFRPAIGMTFLHATVLNLGHKSNVDLNLGVYAAQGDSNPSRVDFGPIATLSYRHVFFGCGFRVQTSRVVTLMGVIW